MKDPTNPLGIGVPTPPLRLDMSMRPLDKSERRRARNDLAKEAMVAIIQKSPFSAGADKTNNWIFDATAASAYAYADAMLAASGDYDDN
jgi:hypothetical protein